MALILADRVRETTTVVGTGPATLLGAIVGYQSFTAVGNGNTTYYVIANQSAGEWEVGVGTYTASGTTLSRDTVLSSSNAGALVNFSAGTKDIWVDYAAGKAVTTDTLAYPPVIGDTTPNAATFTSVTLPAASGNAVISPNTSITSWLYSNKSFSVAGQETAPTGLFIGADGTKMYVNGTTGDDVNEYTLGTAWDVTTATFVTVFSIAAQDGAPADLFFKPDGLSMYVVGDTNNTVFQYTLGTAWSVATASYASKSFSVTSQDANPSGIWFKPDGTTMYIIGSATDTVYQYTLSTAWDVSTAAYLGVFYNIATQETSPQQVNLSADGLQMYVLGQAGDDIWEYNLGTAWNISTATPVNNFYVGFQTVAPTGMFIDSSAPNRVFIVDSTQDAVYQYNTATNSAEFNTDKLYTPGALSVNGNFVAGANAYVDGTLIVQGAATIGSLSVGSTTISGTPTLGTGTGALTVSLGAGATTSGSTKLLNIGTAGLSGSTTNINIGSAVSGSLGTTTISAPTVNIGQTATQFAVTNTASAVNYVQVTGAATGNAVNLSAQGSDTNIQFNINSKNAFGIQFGTGGGTQFLVSNTAAAANYLRATGGSTGTGPILSAQGSDTNISQVFQSKGTGAIDLAAGSSGVNISNGGTVTAITRTAQGFNYTSQPTVVISAPTTAGGVQATAIQLMYFNTATVTAGGTGYTVGDVLSIVGGTPTGGAATLTVSSVSAGVITAVTSTNFAQYSALPASPFSVTGGTGTGATFNPLWGNGSFTITNAGSGYVEQPTVTFSGGGGSGAAAYASVGSAAVIRSLAGAGSTSLEFFTPASISTTVPQLRIRDMNADSFPMTFNQNAGATFLAQGNTNANFNIASNGAGSVRLLTNGGSLVEQLRVAHTASAVNYVQVTGNATTGAPTLSTQGSDTNISMQYLAKGSGVHAFQTGSGFNQFRITATNSAVNYLAVTGGATGITPVMSSAGTDTNIGLNLTTKGTGSLSVNTGGGTQVQIADRPSVINFLRLSGNSAGSGPDLMARGGDAAVNLNLVSYGAGSLDFFTNHDSFVRQMRVANTASAVNYVQVTGAATGSSVVLSAQGSDANIPMTYRTKGTFNHNFQTGAGLTTFVVNQTGGSANYVEVGSSVAGSPVTIKGLGSDTNISQVFQSKGTGAIDLAAGTSGINISNGGTVTAITRTATGNGSYTSKPSVVISAPTTAGGVQATATIDTMGVLLGTVQSGGTGYTVGNTLTVVGGTGSTQTFTVATVSGGVVTGVTNVSFASYSVLPTNPVSTTGGTGSGCTLNLGYNVNTAFTITNAGSGYVEQPTVTFSGGGGSGAAAYASVGSGTTVRSLGGISDFSTPSGIGIRIVDAAGTTSQFLRARSTISGSTGPIFGSASVSETDVNLILASQGAGVIRFNTSRILDGTQGLDQFRVAHTASAVNYVQVTGSTTGNIPAITAQGSDAIVSLAFSSKGFGTAQRFLLGGSEALRIEQFGVTGVVNRFSMFAQTAGGAPLLATRGTDTNVGFDFSTQGTGAYRFYTNTASNGTGVVQFQVAHTASSVNYVQVTGAATGAQPIISSQGSDANIALTLRSKGTFACEFGTSAGTVLFQALPVASSVNYLRVLPSVASASPSITSQGSDTNIDLALTPKGTGNVRFGTLTASADVPITGYIEIKDSSGTIRRLAVVA